MKVILKAEVKGKGKAGDIIEVADSYGRNVIINKGLGVEANAKNLNALKLQKENEARLEAERVAKANSIKEKIDGKELVIKANKGKDGKLFGSITSKEIVDVINGKFGIDIDKKDVRLDKSIKDLGEHDVKIKLHKGIEVKVVIKVE